MSKLYPGISPTAASRMEWQPIDTAPYGVAILVCYKRRNSKTEWCHRIAIFKRIRQIGGNWEMWPTGGLIEPTHWMPLPEPPK